MSQKERTLSPGNGCGSGGASKVSMDWFWEKWSSCSVSSASFMKGFHNGYPPRKTFGEIWGRDY